MAKIIFLCWVGIVCYLLSLGIILPSIISSLLPTWLIVIATTGYIGFFIFLLTKLIEATIHGEWNDK